MIHFNVIINEKCELIVIFFQKDIQNHLKVKIEFK